MLKTPGSAHLHYDAQRSIERFTPMSHDRAIQPGGRSGERSCRACDSVIPPGTAVCPLCGADAATGRPPAAPVGGQAFVGPADTPLPFASANHAAMSTGIWWVVAALAVQILPRVILAVSGTRPAFVTWWFALSLYAGIPLTIVGVFLCARAIKRHGRQASNADYLGVGSGIVALVVGVLALGLG